MSSYVQTPIPGELEASDPVVADNTPKPVGQQVLLAFAVIAILVAVASIGLATFAYFERGDDWSDIQGSVLNASRGTPVTVLNSMVGQESMRVASERLLGEYTETILQQTTEWSQLFPGDQTVAVSSVLLGQFMHSDVDVKDLEFDFKITHPRDSLVLDPASREVDGVAMSTIFKQVEPTVTFKVGDRVVSESKTVKNVDDKSAIVNYRRYHLPFTTIRNTGVKSSEENCVDDYTIECPGGCKETQLTIDFDRGFSNTSIQPDQSIGVYTSATTNAAYLTMMQIRIVWKYNGLSCQ